MAGMGKRLRPHTLTIPKPLYPIAGKPIVQRLAEDLMKMAKGSITEIEFIIGDFGKEVEANLMNIAKKLRTPGVIHYQHEPLGTAHAILCAGETLEGELMIAFADTLFVADFELKTQNDGIVWVNQVEDASSFGVVKINDNKIITDFVEKPDKFISDLAIIGMYYIKDGDTLRNELQYLIDNDIKDKGEYQLTSALENMKNKGKQFNVGSVDEWFDCGNKEAVLYTNQRLLELDNANEPLIDNSAVLEESEIIGPCYIGSNVSIRNSTIGPYTSIGESTKIVDSNIKNTIIQTNSSIENCVLENSMIGNFVTFIGYSDVLNVGDYSTNQ